jgi:hypothetical protein
MTITLTKTKMALSILVVALVIPATAFATHVFDDVPDGAFYAAPVEWAFDNGITTGKSATEFAPLDGVTRGEAVTFLKRYNDNVVDPALATLTADIADSTADIADNTADIADNTADITGNTADIADNTSDITRLNSTRCSGTQTGFRIYDSTAVADDKDWFLDVQLSCVASAALTSANVNFDDIGSRADDGDAACTGTAAAPTAPFGKVCIYVQGSSRVDGLTGYDSLIAGTTFDQRGFTIRGRSNTAAGGDTYARMTWAYTPPLTIILPPILPPILLPLAADAGDTGK